MSWCDKLASTPAVGFRLDPNIVTGTKVLDALSPILNRWAGDRARFSVEQLQDPFSVNVTLDNGFQISVTPLNVAVAFRYKLRAKPQSAGPPQLEMLSQPLPYTEMLPKVSEALAEALLLLPSEKSRTITRVGVVSATTVDDEEAPPGIQRFLKYIGRPWKGFIEGGLSLNLCGETGKGSGWSDRCIHQVTKPEDETLLTINLDWQRTFETGKPITKDSAKDILTKAEKAALDYFEDVAEGNRFDETLLDRPA